MNERDGGAEDDGDGEALEPWELAARRFDFQLSYRRSAERRTITERGFVLTGEWIDNAYVGQPQDQFALFGDRLEQAPGSWEDFDGPLAPETGRELRDPQPEDWLRKYIEMAVQEGVHEVLEWIRIDEQLWLNPHEHEGRVDLAITAAVRGLVAELVEIKQRRGSQAAGTPTPSSPVAAPSGCATHPSSCGASCPPCRARSRADRPAEVGQVHVR